MTKLVDAVIYARISKDIAGEELGVARQLKACRALAKEQGHQIVGEFVDNAVSAFDTRRPRPAYEEMLALVAGGAVGVVIAWASDRLYRRMTDLETLIRVLEEHNVSVRTVVGGLVNLTTSEGRLQARLVGAVAMAESERKSERLRAKHVELAQAGKPPGGPGRTFGYSDNKIVRKEANALRAASRDVIAGRSVRSIAAQWQKKGLTSVGSRGKPRPIAARYLRQMLLSPKIAGVRQYEDKLIRGTWPAIVDLDSWLLVGAVLTDPARRTNDKPHGRYSLTRGLARCALCGAQLIARPRGDGERCYVCASQPGCGKIRILASTFEEFVENQVLEVVDLAKLGRALAQQPAVATVLEVPPELASRKDQLAELFADGAIGADEWTIARDAIQKRIDETSVQVQVEPTVEQVKLDWGELTPGERRVVLEAVLQQVDVGSAVRGRNFFDANRVTLVWRDLN